MSRKRKISIFFDHDLTIRNFIKTNAFEVLNKQYEVDYVFPIHKRISSNLKDLKIKRIVRYKIDSGRIRLINYLQQVAIVKKFKHIKGVNSKTLLSLYKKLWGPRWFFCCNILATFPFWGIFRFCIIKLAGYDRWLLSYLQREKPHCVFHPTVLSGLYASDLPAHCRKLGIKCIFLMNSWDNPSIKATAFEFPDLLGVWGEQSRLDAVHIFGIPKIKVKVIGASQFEVFKKKPKTSRSEFFQKNNLNMKKRIFLYAGSSKGLNETEHLKILERKIGDYRARDWQILYRPHPWKKFAPDEKNFLSQAWSLTKMDDSCKNIYLKNFLGHEFNVVESCYNDVHNVLSHVDCVFSPLSTFVLEAALHGKPGCVYLDDEKGPEKTFRYAAKHMLHFRPFLEKVSVIKCTKKILLQESLEKLICNSTNTVLKQRLKTESEYFVKTFSDSYGKRLVKMVP